VRKNEINISSVTLQIGGVVTVDARQSVATLFDADDEQRITALQGMNQTDQ